MARYRYIGPSLEDGVVESDALASTTERRRVRLDISPAASATSPVDAARDGQTTDGVVLGLTSGLPDRARLRLVSRALRRGPVWLYWPDERAVERVDRARLRSLWRHWAAAIALERGVRPMKRLADSWSRTPAGLRWIYRGTFPVRRFDLIDELGRWSAIARPVPFDRLETAPDSSKPIRGTGLYVRADFWLNNISGGSYGHTCYVAKELSAVTDHLVCMLAQRFSLLDDLGVHQVLMEPPAREVSEDAIVSAPEHYYPILKAACQVLRPAYIYERICIGNSVAARLSRELRIPYIVEYNGSEISMQRSFNTRSPFFYEDVYLKVEELAFRQAAVISVISEPVKHDLVARGIDARKILVNPNGADLDAYAPADADEKRRIRAELGFDAGDRVVGFTGTFGGWHGIDVLAAAIPRVCRASAAAKFLIIGDGEQKPKLDAEVAHHGFDARVVRVGRVAQAEGARLLKACDIYVSPHNTHMVDHRFFGSPTKIFEYMAMGGGIVASDLEQIGEVLSPALRLSDFRDATPPVTQERAVLCTPGAVDEFADAVVALVERPDVSAVLGRNARQAVIDCYSWRQHVRRLWTFAAALSSAQAPIRLETGDPDKDQVQRQWNHNPVGSETARTQQPHTLEWFLEIERHRYGIYAPWMPSVMEFGGHAGEAVLEIGGGLGTDLAQFARHGARVTDLDLSAGHLSLAEENFRLRGLQGRFVHHDAESLPFDDAAFDLVYTNGVLHHTPDTERAVAEIHRVLRPGGRVIAMVYAERSLHYWRNLVWDVGIRRGDLSRLSMGEILSQNVERSSNEAKPLVKVYTRARLRQLFRTFRNVRIVQRQISRELLPPRFRWLAPAAERVAGWNLIVTGEKPDLR